jgi:excisionase family DNA binding protein
MSEEKHLTAYRTVELAKLLGVSKRTLQRWRLEGGGPQYARIGRDCLYLVRDIEGWLERRRFWNRSEELDQSARYENLASDRERSF